LCLYDTGVFENSSVSALTLLVGSQEGCLVYKRSASVITEGPVVGE